MRLLPPDVTLPPAGSGGRTGATTSGTAADDRPHATDDELPETLRHILAALTSYDPAGGGVERHRLQEPGGAPQATHMVRGAVDPRPDRPGENSARQSGI
jgi:hypothetical protein